MWWSVWYDVLFGNTHRVSKSVLALLGLDLFAEPHTVYTFYGKEVAHRYY